MKIFRECSRFFALARSYIRDAVERLRRCAQTTFYIGFLPYLAICTKLKKKRVKFSLDDENTINFGQVMR